MAELEIGAGVVEIVELDGLGVITFEVLSAVVVFVGATGGGAGNG